MSSASHRPRVTVLSHMFPKAASPLAGPFVADQVSSLSEEFDVSVVSPIPWIPWARGRGAADGAPPCSRSRAVAVLQPSVLGIPRGGLTIETRLWPPRLRRLVTSLSPQLVHAHFGLPDGWAAAQIAKALRVPFVLTLWGSDAMLYPRKRRLRQLLAEAIQGAARVFAASAPIARVAMELGARASDVAVTPGGIPDEYGGPSREDARVALGLDADATVVAWIGRFVDVKRPATAIEAVAGMREEVELLMIGDGPLRRAAESAATQLGVGARVHFTGSIPRSDISLYQSAADVLLNSSFSEGTPLTACEAFACGTPVVSFAVGGLPDVIGRDGGTIAMDDSPAALGAALQRELATTRSRDVLVRRADPYRLSSTTATVRAVYRELTDG